MKRFAAPALMIAIVVIGGIQMNRRSSAKVEAAEKEASLLRIQRDYLERVGWIRSIPDEKTYRDEVGTFFRWYFKEVDEYRAANKANKDFDEYLVELESRGKDAQLVERKAYFAKVKKTLDRMREGNYAPQWTAVANGLRLDVVSTDVEMVAGTPKIRYSLVLWGAQREMKQDGNLKRMFTSAAFSASWKLLGPKGKLLYSIEANGDPSMKIDWPERFIAEFPPQMVLGHYDIDLIPADVETVEIAFNVSSRSASGGDAVGAFSWKLPVPSEWKLKDGEKWENAEVSERSEEEISGEGAR